MRHIFPGAFPPPPPEPSIPAGLVQLMEGLSRDVITNNPTDIYKFCAEHMHKLLQIRSVTQTKKYLMTTEEKIAKAQATVRQRAQQRCDRFDSEKRSNGVYTMATQQDFINNIIEVENNERDIHKHLENNVKNVESEYACAMIPSTNITVNRTQDNDNETYGYNVEVDAISNTEKNKNLVEDVSQIEDVMQKVLTEQANNKNLHGDKVSDQHFEETPHEHDSNNDFKVNMGSILIENMQNTSELDNNDILSYESKKTEKSNISSIKDNNTGNVVMSGEENNLIQVAPDTKLESTEVKELSKKQTVEAFEYDDANTEYSVKKVNESAKKISNEIIDSNTAIDNVVENVHDESVGNKLKNEMLYDESKQTEIQPLPEENVNNDNSLLNNDTQISTIINNVDFASDVIPINDPDPLVANIKSSTQLKIDVNGELNNINSNNEAQEGTGTDYEQYKNKENYSTVETLSESIQSEEIDTISEFQVTKSHQTTDVNHESSNLNPSSISSEECDNTTEIDIINETDEEKPAVSLTESIINDIEANNEQWSKQSNMNSQATGVGGKTLNDNCNEIHEESSYSEFTNGTNKNTMDLETAAVTIQKVFRSFLMNRASTLDDVSNEESLDAPYLPEDTTSEDSKDGEHKDECDFLNTTANKERRGMGITRMDTVLQTVNEEKSLSLSDDSSTLSSAATVIQAHVRGFLVRNRMHTHKTNSLINSEGISVSMDGDNEQIKNKTVLNIHIVPESGYHYLSRDESMAMSVDLPLDGSSLQTSSSLHSLGYDITERRKLLKREDAVQSISPPSNNSGNSDTMTNEKSSNETIIKVEEIVKENPIMSGDTSPTKSSAYETVVEVLNDADLNNIAEKKCKTSSDEIDVVTPYVTSEQKLGSSVSSEDGPRLMHSGEFHELVLPLPLPTEVSRRDSPVVREFKNVMGFFLIWNNSP